MVLVPSQYRTIAVVFHSSAVGTRFILAVLDTIWAHAWTDSVTGVCRFKDKHEVT